MRLLPQCTILGKIEIVEVYEYYDNPCLFSCRNASGLLFLAVWIGETNDFKTWLYVPMSQKRLENVRAGVIDLRNAFIASEDGFVYKVIIPCNDSKDKVEPIFSEELIDDWLPIAGEFLDLGNEPFPINQIQESTQTTTQIQ